ncbi:DNA-binding response regulator, OmpR family, contains REC and winged-helix (wHTH) domain [Prauserella aidingensis]|nr:DNA-binding response regulator, OmpR family, contains REC and winged-helix (wHTH) domain [Prauserella aidingensis]
MQAELIRRYLHRDGHTVAVVQDGRSAIDEARRQRPDLAVLDVMMPKVDGLDVCRVLRAESDLPIVLLTARTTEDDVLLGLDLGADDYVTKPYSPRQLAARVRAILRRAGRGSPQQDGVLEVDDLVVDRQRHKVVLAGVPLDCTPAEFGLLATLAAEPGRVFTRGQLLDQALGMDRFVTERTVDVHVMNLRRKLEADPRKPARLITVYGVGYKLQDGAVDAAS